MWGFGVYREAEGSLLLCRDRFGEKPLYLYRDATGLYFGSEVKFIAALLGQRLRVNRDHLRRYLVNGYKALYKGRDTFFEGVVELPAAHHLRIGADGSEMLERYWQPRPAIKEDMSYEEAAEVTGCALGTVKSRIARGRAALTRMINGNAEELEGGEAEVVPKPESAKRRPKR